MLPEGRSSWFVVVVVVMLGSVGLSAMGLTALRGEIPLRMASATPVLTGTPLASHESVATPPPIRTTTPIPTQTATPTPAATAAAPPEDVEYVVVSGDVLERIAAQFGVTAQAIAERNNLVPPYRIEVGDVLLIPTAE